MPHWKLTLAYDGTPYNGWQIQPGLPTIQGTLARAIHHITGKTVLQRRDRLEQIITPISGIQVGGYVEARGKDLFALAKRKGTGGHNCQT